MNIFYKCKCMKSEATLEVADRREDEQIEDWMQHVQMAISVDHRKRNALCTADKMEYAKIPVEKDLPIGQKRILQ